MEIQFCHLLNFPLQHQQPALHLVTLVTVSASNRGANFVAGSLPLSLIDTEDKYVKDISHRAKVGKRNIN